ncbi:NrsF family protein [Terricaulis sp.]|uniref:NrsF family protein n=1 Tax=Terricaulis sp. TaxID=2768686 RepID=UPI0037841D49
MKTDQLIEALARNVEPVERPKWARRMAITVIAGVLIAVVAVVLTIGARPDIGTAMMPVMMKAGFSALAAAIVLPVTVQLMKPGRPLGWRIGAIVVFVALCAIVVIVALMGTPSEQRMSAWMGGDFPWCLVLIPILAAPTAAGLVWIMRALAPTRLTLSGAAIGAFSGGVGAMAYAMYCPVDSIAFVTTWYTLAIALCAALGALIGSKFLRW